MLKETLLEREALVRRILVTKEPCKEGAYQVVTDYRGKAISVKECIYKMLLFTLSPDPAVQGREVGDRPGRRSPAL